MYIGKYKTRDSYEPLDFLFIILRINYPPKLSNMIMSSSTPSKCKRSSTVFDIIGGPRQNGLATKNSLGSLGLPAFFLFPKIGRFLGALLEWVPLRLSSYEQDYT